MATGSQTLNIPHSREDGSEEVGGMEQDLQGRQPMMK